jgi:hypothetical protein
MLSSFLCYQIARFIQISIAPMKKLLTILAFTIIAVTFLTCSKDNNDDSYKEWKKKSQSEQEWLCGNYNGYTLYTGPRGGCYYKKLNKDLKEEIIYVDKKYCKCLE